MSSDQQTNQKTPPPSGEPRELSTKAFLTALGFVSCLYAAVLIYHVSTPVESVTNHDSIMEQCRQVCMQYGLITTGNVRKDAEAYLEVVQPKQLTAGLEDLLADSSFVPVESQPHVLLNQRAPEFSLPDVKGLTQKLGDLNNDRPVVVVFYLGYGCSHCVAQLLAIDKDLHYFTELDADVVAISSDSPEHTAERYKEYGEFHFPVLADTDYAVSKNWGVYKPETDATPELMHHGTFVLDKQGRLIWAAQGQEPFLDNRTLLHVIAKSQGLMPAKIVAGQATSTPQLATHEIE